MILSAIESVDSSVRVFVKIFWKIQDNFGPDNQLDSIAPPRRSVGFDRDSGAIESSWPSASKLSWIFQNFHEPTDRTVHTLNETEYSWFQICLLKVSELFPHQNILSSVYWLTTTISDNIVHPLRLQRPLLDACTSSALAVPFVRVDIAITKFLTCFTFWSWF